MTQTICGLHLALLCVTVGSAVLDGVRRSLARPTRRNQMEVDDGVVVVACCLGMSTVATIAPGLPFAFLLAAPLCLPSCS